MYLPLALSVNVLSTGTAVELPDCVLVDAAHPDVPIRLPPFCAATMLAPSSV